jgi:hypothetical protein
VSSPVFDGLPPLVRTACRVGESAEMFASETLSLLNLPGAERRRLARTVNLEQLGWDSQLRPLHGLLSDAAAGVAIAV